MSQQIVKVGERKVRGLAYLPNGQQFNGWVPKGHYRFVGECEVNYSSLGTHMTATAWKIENDKEGTWYIGPRTAILHDVK